MIIREEYTCSLELVQDMMKGKRKCSIIWRLRLGPAVRFKAGYQGDNRKNAAAFEGTDSV